MTFCSGKYTTGQPNMDEVKLEMDKVRIQESGLRNFFLPHIGLARGGTVSGD